MFDFFNAYRLMWVLVFYDLPTDTKTQRKAAAKFRNDIMKDGFAMFQFSIYVRHCLSKENMQAHVNRVKKALPLYGRVGILTITDKQFGDMELFCNAAPQQQEGVPQQLELF